MTVGVADGVRVIAHDLDDHLSWAGDLVLGVSTCFSPSVGREYVGCVRGIVYEYVVRTTENLSVRHVF